MAVLTLHRPWIRANTGFWQPPPWQLVVVVSVILIALAWAARHPPHIGVMEHWRWHGSIPNRRSDLLWPGHARVPGGDVPSTVMEGVYHGSRVRFVGYADYVAGLGDAQPSRRPDPRPHEKRQADPAAKNGLSCPSDRWDGVGQGRLDYCAQPAGLLPRLRNRVRHQRRSLYHQRQTPRREGSANHQARAVLAWRGPAEPFGRHIAGLSHSHRIGTLPWPRRWWYAPAWRRMPTGRTKR